MRFGAKVKDVSSCSMDASETYIFVSCSLSLDKVYVILVLLLSLPLGARPLGEEVVILLSILFTFVATVAGEVVAYYLCKWLDSWFFKGSKH